MAKPTARSELKEGARLVRRVLKAQAVDVRLASAVIEVRCRIPFWASALISGTERPPPWRTPNVRRREASLGRMSLCQCVIQTSSANGRSSWPERVTNRSLASRPISASPPSCLRRWMKQDDIDRGRSDGLDTDERAELVRLRRELRTAQMEVEILRRAAAYFAKETLPGPK